MKMARLYGAPDPENVEETYRVAGIYRGGFELSHLAVYSEEPPATIPSFTPFDFCLGVAPICQKTFRRATRVEGALASRYPYFGVIHAVVKYEGPREWGEDCPLGHITVLRLISVEREDSEGLLRSFGESH